MNQRPLLPREQLFFPRRRSSPARFLPCAVAVLVCAVALTSCTRVSPVRTLPSWVRGIYIPMFDNKSYEPGLEEVATRATQEAFLADGRVDVVREQDADLLLMATITGWDRQSGRTTGDKVTERDDVTMVVELKLYEPLNKDLPLADLGAITVRTPFYIDTRSTEFVPEPERRRQFMEIMADMIVQQTISGFPVGLEAAPAGAALPPIASPAAPNNEPVPTRAAVEGMVN